MKFGEYYIRGVVNTAVEHAKSINSTLVKK